MNSKYDMIRDPENYWDSLLDTVSERELILMLIKKIDQLNDRVYEAQVRAEDAYQEMARIQSLIMRD